jgi:hypothetical protein
MPLMRNKTPIHRHKIVAPPLIKSRNPIPNRKLRFIPIIKRIISPDDHIRFNLYAVFPQFTVKNPLLNP